VKRPRSDAAEGGDGGVGVDDPAGKRRRVSPEKEGSRQEGGVVNGRLGNADVKAEGEGKRVPHGGQAIQALQSSI